MRNKLTFFKKIFVKKKKDVGVEYFISKLLKKKNKLTFIQVGSNNGIDNDPLCSFIKDGKIEGILIEPVRHLFLQLVKNYEGYLNLNFEEAAMDKNIGERTLYRIERKGDIFLPPWFDQLASFDKGIILSHEDEIDNLENLIIEEKVRCINFDFLIEKYNIYSIDIIHVDTEGYDYEIIKMIPLDTLKPSLIVYEHKHLSVDDRLHARLYLKKNDYLTFETINDTIAYK